MSTQALKHRRTHNLLLIQRLLSSREGSSPFTLVQDSLEQSGRPLIEEYMQRAKIAKNVIIYISYETLKPVPGIDMFLNARRKNAMILQKEIFLIVNKLASGNTTSARSSTSVLLVVDTLHPLAANSSLNLPAFLSSLIIPHVSLIATYHLDIPTRHSTFQLSPYAPNPLALLRYLATTIITIHSLAQVLSRKRASERSLSEPVFGLGEETDGVLVGMGSNDRRGLVLEVEYRRKSGRGVGEWFVLEIASTSAVDGKEKVRERERVMLLEDHPLYQPQDMGKIPGHGDRKMDEEGTFNLGITEKQRRDREGVVLPYFDAQKEGGGGGGRILYDMGVEDDFDEEDDEI